MPEKELRLDARYGKPCQAKVVGLNFNKRCFPVSSPGSEGATHLRLIPAAEVTYRGSLEIWQWEAEISVRLGKAFLPHHTSGHAHRSGRDDSLLNQ